MKVTRPCSWFETRKTAPPLNAWLALTVAQEPWGESVTEDESKAGTLIVKFWAAVRVASSAQRTAAVAENLMLEERLTDEQDGGLCALYIIGAAELLV